MLRYTVHFSGRVQGVGFRYTARQIAQNHKVSGYVQNLPDRRVLMVAEGEPDQLDVLVADILQAMAGHVRDHTINTSPATGEFGTPGVDELTIKH